MRQTRIPSTKHCEPLAALLQLAAGLGCGITFVNLVKGDLGKKRADPAVLRTAKKFFQKADEPRKSGRQGMLAHRWGSRCKFERPGEMGEGLGSLVGPSWTAAD